MTVPRRTVLWALAFACGGAAPTTSPTASPSTGPAVVPSAAATTGPATAPTVDPSIAALIRQLDADDWQARDAAAEQLVARGEAVRAAMAEAAAHADSPEVRSRAAGVIAKLDQRIADRPTTVSLHFANANPREVFAELGRQAGVRFAYLPDMIWRPGAFGGAANVTVDLTDQPFWSALDEVCKQAGGQVTTYVQTGGDLTIMAGAGDPLLAGPISDRGRLTVVARSYSRERQLSYADGANHGSDTIGLLALIDPKLRLAPQAQPLVAVAVASDDKGASLVLPADAAGGRPVRIGVGAARMANGAMVARAAASRDFNGSGPMRALAVDLKPPSAGATKLAVLKGTVTVVAVGASETMTVDDAAHAGHVVRTVGPYVVDVDQVTVAGPTVSYSLSVRSTDGTAIPRALRDIRLEDAAGHAIGGSGGSWTVDVDNGRAKVTAQVTAAAAIGGPVRLLWTVATRTRTVALPFEFHDLPLPPP